MYVARGYRKASSSKTANKIYLCLNTSLVLCQVYNFRFSIFRITFVILVDFISVIYVYPLRRKIANCQIYRRENFRDDVIDVLKV